MVRGSAPPDGGPVPDDRLPSPNSSSLRPRPNTVWGDYTGAGGPGARAGPSVGEVDALDRLVLDRPVAGAGRRRLDRLDGIHALGHPAEHRVLAVEPRRRAGRDDEELRAVRIGTGIGHRQGAPLHLVVVELVLERVAAPARAGVLRASALEHEVGD